MRPAIYILLNDAARKINCLTHFKYISLETHLHFDVTPYCIWSQIFAIQSLFGVTLYDLDIFNIYNVQYIFVIENIPWSHFSVTLYYV